MFYAKSTGGFYTEEIHGSRRIFIIDPAWVHPLVTITLQPNESFNGVVNTGNRPLDITDVPDPSVISPLVEVDNPDCKIPADAVEITEAEHALLLEGQSQGKRIVADANGRPMLADPPPPTAAEIWYCIKAKRDSVKAGGVKVGSHWFHSDEASRTQYVGLLRMADAAVTAGGSGSTTLQYSGQDIQWKTMDGTFIKMTVQCANDVFAAVSGLDFAAFGVAEAHKAAMEAAADPATYDFSTGWPATFGG